MDRIEPHGLGAVVDSFPRGNYRAAPLLYTGVVVVSALPVTRSTLLVRLMGAGTVLKHAIAELKALPLDARERLLALPILLHVRLEVPEDPAKRTSDDEEFLMFLVGSRVVLGIFYQLTAAHRTLWTNRNGFVLPIRPEK
jgi:hypothetical protein